MNATLKQIEFLLCPHCGDGEHRVEHIQPGGSFGPWYCDACGGSFVGRRGAEGAVDVELRTERKVVTVDVLMLRPQKKPVYFVVEGMRFEGGRTSDIEPDERARYYYEEHSCPVNWLKPVMVYHDGDDDPHGLIEFVTRCDSSSLPPDETWGPNERDRAMVNLIEERASDRG